MDKLLEGNVMSALTIAVVFVVVVVGGVYLILNDTGYTFTQYLDDVKGLWPLIGLVAGARALPAAAKKLPARRS